ncbi:DUF4329 domain-containing protein [Pseudomonas frederiksbergensis]|uniref:DUF4329 domain-containing protein n=1 Tax=Pseudomonas frederiksbergensis TaxID=104087 RepID=UPI003D1D2CBC
MDTELPFLPEVPSLSRAYISADDAAVFVHEQLSNRRDREYGGFILKNAVGHFFATHPERGESYAFDPAQVLALDEKGDFVPPKGYSIAGMYHSHWVTSGMRNESPREHGLRDSFFSVSDLASAITYRHNYPRFYLSGNGGALVMYISSDSDAERALHPILQRDARGWPGILEQAHIRGSLLTSQLIALVAASGDLRVVMPGDVWKTRGRVAVGWEVQVTSEPAVSEQPVCGPVCDSAREAALYAHARIKGMGDAVFAGFILKHRQADQYVATEPFACDYAAFNRESIFPRDYTLKPALPEGFRVFAVYHSMTPKPAPPSESEMYEQFFSPRDMRVGLDRLLVAPGLCLFLSTPGGALLSFRSTQTDNLRTLIARLSPPTTGQSEIEQALADGQLLPEAFIDLLAAAGELKVELPGEGWPTAGRVLPD